MEQQLLNYDEFQRIHVWSPGHVHPVTDWPNTPASQGNICENLDMVRNIPQMHLLTTVTRWAPGDTAQIKAGIWSLHCLSLSCTNHQDFSCAAGLPLGQRDKNEQRQTLNESSIGRMHLCRMFCGLLLVVFPFGKWTLWMGTWHMDWWQWSTPGGTLTASRVHTLEGNSGGKTCPHVKRYNSYFF